MIAEILCVGTELLLGDIVNTNAQFLSVELASLGISVMHQSTVGDNADRLRTALKDALSRSDIVITSGGLGPTADDITKEVCAEVMGFELELNSSSLTRIKDFFAKKYSDKMPQTNVKQAYMPKGSTIFKNDCGTAPGCAMEKDDKCVILLPGPPIELTAMFNSYVKPFLKKYSNGVIVSHSVRTFGLGESAMAQSVSDLLNMSNPTVAPYAKEGEALLRVTAMAENEKEAEALIKPVLEDICNRLGDKIYGIDTPNIQQKAVELLLETNTTVSVAESCTAGYVAKRITEISGASAIFECGIISYSNRIKKEILHVSEDTLKEYGAVSEQTAKEMAFGVKNLSGADIGIGVTGIAGPKSDDSKKPVGLSYVALYDGENYFVREVMTGRENQREYNRYVTASNALDMIRLYVQGKLNVEE